MNLKPPSARSRPPPFPTKTTTRKQPLPLPPHQPERPMAESPVFGSATPLPSGFVYPQPGDKFKYSSPPKRSPSPPRKPKFEPTISPTKEKPGKPDWLKQISE